MSSFQLFLLGTAPLALPDHFGQVSNRANLEGSRLHTGVIRHQLDGVVQVRGFEPAQLLFRLGIGAIGDCHVAVLPSQGGGFSSALEHFATHKVTPLSKHAVVGKALVHQSATLTLGHGVPRFLVKVSKANIFIVSSECADWFARQRPEQQVQVKASRAYFFPTPILRKRSTASLGPK
jgi:hypothetical protein